VKLAAFQSGLKPAKNRLLPEPLRDVLLYVPCGIKRVHDEADRRAKYELKCANRKKLMGMVEAS